jgi:hypothetical protein
VRTTHGRADGVQHEEGPQARSLPAAATVYLIAMRGHFCWKTTIPPEAGCAPVALTQVSATVGSGKGSYGLSTVAKHYPNLRALGKPFQLHAPKR